MKKFGKILVAIVALLSVFAIFAAGCIFGGSGGTNSGSSGNGGSGSGGNNNDQQQEEPPAPEFERPLHNFTALSMDKYQQTFVGLLRAGRGFEYGRHNRFKTRGFGHGSVYGLS